MGKFGGPTPKRHMGWSNDEQFMQDLMARGGYMSVAERKDIGTAQLVRRGKNRGGMPTFTGAKQLKKSQSLVSTDALCFSASILFYVR